MKIKFKYHYNHSTGILFKYYYGAITIEDIESSWNYAFENNLIPYEVKGFILDYQESNLNVNIDDYNAIANFYKKHIKIFGNLRIAILTKNPKDIVIPMLVETKDDGYKSKPFSTLEAAINWVLN